MDDLKEMKQTELSNLYVMVPHKRYEFGKEVTKLCLLSVKKMESLKGVAPTKEILETHFQAERIRLKMAKEKNEKYVPQPLYIETEKGVFDKIVEEVNKKDKMIGRPDVIALTLGSNIPCCIISKRQDEHKNNFVKNKENE